MMLRKTSLFLLIAVLWMSTSITLAETGSSSSNMGGDSTHAVALYNLGLSAYKQGSPESAIIFFKRAVDLDPNLADAQYNLGVLYQSERRLKEAVPRFKEALRVKPEDADSHYQLALALIDLNELQEAKQNLMAIAPNSSHFSDAQKRIAAIDGQMANSGAAVQQAISQPVSPQPANLNYSNPSVAASTPVTEVPTVNQQNLGISSSANSAIASPSTTVAPNIGAVAAVPPVPVAATASPSVLIDNANLQVVAVGFSAPSGLTFDNNGNLYVANFVTSTIDRLSPDGRKSQFSTGVNLKGPIGLVCDADNNIYVANYLAGTITRINPAGIAQIIVSGLKKPYYLAMDKQGNLFVSQQEDNTIVRVNFSHNNSDASTRAIP